MGMIDQLKAREEQKRPIRIGMIGGGEIWDNVHGAGSAYSGRPCFGCS